MGEYYQGEGMYENSKEPKDWELGPDWEMIHKFPNDVIFQNHGYKR